MKKKDSILKRHPIIPSIFFLLFAWVLLYLITGFKEPSQTDQPLISLPSTFRGVQPDWQLDIKKAGIRFELEKETFTYPYQAPQESSKEALRVIRSENGESAIQILILNKQAGGCCEVIVEKDGEFYHSQGIIE